MRDEVSCTRQVGKNGSHSGAPIASICDTEEAMPAVRMAKAGVEGEAETDAGTEAQSVSCCW